MFVIFATIPFLVSLVAHAMIQDFYWRDFSPNNVPHDAIAGSKGRYIGQVVFKDAILPATIYPQRHFAAVAVSDKRIDIKQNVKILCSRHASRFYWKPVHFSLPDIGQMENVIKGGYRYGSNLYIGRANHEDEWKIGKVVDITDKELKGLWVWNHLREQVQMINFDILKYNASITSPTCSNIIM